MFIIVTTAAQITIVSKALLLFEHKIQRIYEHKKMIIHLFQVANPSIGLIAQNNVIGIKTIKDNHTFIEIKDNGLKSLCFDMNLSLVFLSKYFTNKPIEPKRQNNASQKCLNEVTS